MQNFCTNGIWKVFCAALSLLTACAPPGWEVETDARLIAGPVIEQGQLFVTVSRFDVVRQLRAYSPRTGEELWQVPLSSWDDCPHLTARDERVVVACGETVLGFERVTGLRQWSHHFEGPVQQLLSGREPMLLVSARVQERELVLKALDSVTGQEKYALRLKPDARVLRFPKRLVIQEAQRLRGLELERGDPLWEVPWSSVDGELKASEGMLVVLSARGVAGWDVETGAQRWVLPTEGRVSPSLQDGLLVYAQAGQLMGVDLMTGQTRWSQRMAGVISSPLLTHEDVFVHTAGGALRVHSAVDGVERWSAMVGAPGSYPVVNDLYYAWVGTGQVHVVDLKARRRIQRVELDLMPEPEGVDPDRMVEQPLKLEGDRLYGIQQRRRLFMVQVGG
ncbi:MAG: PQQ-binding-like beta-propeller repeat protein [Myxococcota bacterium]